MGSSELNPLDQNILLRSNDREIRRDLNTIWNKNNLALSVRQFSSDTTLDVSDSIALCSGGSFTITLPSANSWSSRSISRSPFINVVGTGAGTITVAPKVGEFITGPTTVPAGTSMYLFADGNITWLSFAVPNSTGVYVLKSGDTMTGPLTNGGGPEVIQLDGSAISATYTKLEFKDGTIASPKSNTTYKTPMIYVERHTNNSST